MLTRMSAAHVTEDRKATRMNHIRAREILLSTPHGLPDDLVHPVLSHWLQAPSTVPILGDRALQRLWKNTLTGAVGSSELSIRNSSPFPQPNKPSFTFIDLFAGIGGFRLGLRKSGGKCVFSSEIDPAAQRTYDANFGEVPFGDIRLFTDPLLTDDFLQASIPTHDVLAAGFPCQPFSRAGVSARTALGGLHGFDDEISGTLFFDIIRIAKLKKPKVLFLENVKNLVRHDSGKTFQVIRERIEQLGYHFEYAVINSSRLVPQRRVRTYIVASRIRPFEFNRRPFESGDEVPLGPHLDDNVDESFTISDARWMGHQRRTARNLARGAGFTAFTADLARPSNTLVARYGKDGKECLIPQGRGKNPRMLTPRESARLQGFPESFELYPARTVAYRQFGNAVAVPVISELGRQIRKHLE